MSNENHSSPEHQTSQHGASQHEATDAAFEERSAEAAAGDQSAENQAGQASTAAQRGETRDEEMERLRQAAQSADKRVLMAQAEAENFRKRMRRDLESQLKYAAMPLVIDLLQVRDNLHRALEAAGPSDNGGLKDGVAMVAKQLDDALAKHAIVEIPAAGELFDPNYHEAISQMPSDNPAGTIAHVATTGFQMHDRVIRPSQVIVSTGPPE